MLAGASVYTQPSEGRAQDPCHEEGWQTGEDWPDDEREEQEAALAIAGTDRQGMNIRSDREAKCAKRCRQPNVESG